MGEGGREKRRGEGGRARGGDGGREMNDEAEDKRFSFSLKIKKE